MNKASPSTVRGIASNPKCWPTLATDHAKHAPQLPRLQPRRFRLTKYGRSLRKSVNCWAQTTEGARILNHYVGAWRSLVAHLHGVQGVVCSNHIAPTISFRADGVGLGRRRCEKPGAAGAASAGTHWL